MPAESRVEILARLLGVKVDKFKVEYIEIINNLSDQEFDCIVSIRAKIPDPEVVKHYDHCILEGI